MIYLMLCSKSCGHLYVWNYQFHVPMTGLKLC